VGDAKALTERVHGIIAAAVAGDEDRAASPDLEPHAVS
jgi:hypothetical protein